MPTGTPHHPPPVPPAEFGAAPPPSHGAGASTGVGAEGPPGALSFLDYVSCALCGHDLNDASEPRPFWMMSCGHTLCGAAEHAHEKGRCTYCKKDGIDAYAINDPKEILPELRDWFRHPRDHATSLMASLESTMQETMQQLRQSGMAVVQFQNEQLLTLVARLRGNTARLQTEVATLKVRLRSARVSAHVANASHLWLKLTQKETQAMIKAEMDEAGQHLEALTTELARLRGENEQLKRDAESDRVNMTTHHGTPQMQNGFRPSSRAMLASVSEVDEDGDRQGIHNMVPEIERHVAEEQRFRGAGAGRPSPTRSGVATAHRVTLPFEGGSTRGTASDRSSDGGRVDVRRNLERFKFAGGTTSGTPQTHPYSRPASALAHPRYSGPGLGGAGAGSSHGYSHSAPTRPASALGASGGGFAPAGPVRGYAPSPFVPNQLHYQPQQYMGGEPQYESFLNPAPREGQGSGSGFAPGELENLIQGSDARPRRVPSISSRPAEANGQEQQQVALQQQVYYQDEPGPQDAYIEHEHAHEHAPQDSLPLPVYAQDSGSGGSALANVTHVADGGAEPMGDVSSKSRGRQVLHASGSKRRVGI